MRRGKMEDWFRKCNTLLAVLLLLLASSLLCAGVRYMDKTFPAISYLYGKNVTCDSDGKPGKPGQYAGKTYTCHKIKVDGLPLSYGYIEGLGTTNNCGRDKGNHSNDYNALCEELLNMHVATDLDNPPKLWASMVSDASCQVSESDRMAFRRLRPTNQSEERFWRKLESGRGYVITLQCMLHPEPDT